MADRFDTPQATEDAFYDALEEHSLDRMMAVWEDSSDIACLLPMQPMLGGVKVLDAWRSLLEGDMRIDVEVHHLQWIEMRELAIHYVEERVTILGQPQKQQPVYATNIYRKGDDGWRMILHQNAPMPPPPDIMASMMETPPR